MNLSVTGHHVAITPAIRTYVESKLDRVLRHSDRVTTVSVILSVQKLRQKAEANVHVRGKDLYVEADHEDLYAAIDAMIDKLDRQVLKHKGRTGTRPHDALKHQAGSEKA
jgi:putative sigma-54 modulation protein